MSKLLPLKDFRARRRVLSAEDFAIGGAEVPPSDLIDQSTWEGLTTLPTDVAIQTSDHQGTQLKILHVLGSLWVEAIGVPKDGDIYENDMTFAPMLSAAEDFDAATFNALHGFYRPSIGCARNALEVMTVGCACQTLNRHEQFLAWQDGLVEFWFGSACELLVGAESLQALNRRLASTLHDSLFDKGTRDACRVWIGRGWVRRLYAHLCNYSHSRPGFTSGDL